MEILQAKTADLIPYGFNNRDHSQQQIDRIANSINEFGFNQPIVVDEQNIVLVGHGRLEAAKKLGLEDVPVLKKIGLSETQKKAYRILDNKLQNDSTWNTESLEIEFAALEEADFDLEAFGLDDLESLFASPVNDKKTHGSLASTFLIPPFSVLNSREGWWQERKRFWINKGIQSEAGRKEDLLGADTIKSGYGKTFVGRDPKTKELIYKDGCGNTSIFDPVLCELIYKWFTCKGDTVLDPFAGGSVRGVVAAHLSRRYIGQDVRIEQVEANRIQWESIVNKDSELSENEGFPIWRHGDSRFIDQDLSDIEFDFLFSCPPYGDLEKYSDEPQDISNLSYGDFIIAYEDIIQKSCARLKNDAFACFVVGDIRDKAGHYKAFVSDTIKAFRSCGLHLYNEAILVEPIGSRFLFAGRIFQASRKLAKTHQNVLIFIKGDLKKAVLRLGECECGSTDVGESFGEPVE